MFEKKKDMFYKWVFSFRNLKKKKSPQNGSLVFYVPEKAKNGLFHVFGHASWLSNTVWGAFFTKNENHLNEKWSNIPVNKASIVVNVFRLMRIYHICNYGSRHTPLFSENRKKTVPIRHPSKKVRKPYIFSLSKYVNWNETKYTWYSD